MSEDELRATERQARRDIGHESDYPNLPFARWATRHRVEKHPLLIAHIREGEKCINELREEVEELLASCGKFDKSGYPQFDPTRYGWNSLADKEDRIERLEREIKKMEER